MPRRRQSPEDVVAKLRQVDALIAQGLAIGDALRSTGVTDVTYRRWQSEYGGLIRILRPAPE
jgi:hypothetical protein